MGGQSRLSASLSSPDCHYPNVVYSPRGQLASRCLVFREQRDGNSGIEMEPSRPSFRDSSPSLQKSLPVQVTTPMCALLTERGTHQTNELSAFASVDFFFLTGMYLSTYVKSQHLTITCSQIGRVQVIPAWAVQHSVECAQGRWGFHSLRFSRNTMGSVPSTIVNHLLVVV